MLVAALRFFEQVKQCAKRAKAFGGVSGSAMSPDSE
jgi:hypothetical protein